jgi:hypothetical protein
MRLHRGAESTVGDGVRAAAPSGFPAGLFSPGGLARIEAVADQVPGRLTSTFGFEIELAAAAGGGDFALAVTGLHGGREMLAGTSEFELPLAASEHPAWVAVRALSRAWVDPLSGLDPELHNLALEFDLPEGVAGVPPPNVFLGARSGISARSPIESAEDERSWAWLTEAALPVLRGRRLSTSQRETLGRCFRALPGGARAFQVGVMLARPVDALRVCILGMRYDRVAGYLDDIGWPGDADALEEQVGPLARRAESVIVDLDVAEGVLPSLGLECFVGEQGSEKSAAGGGPEAQERWSRFLQPLVERGLCTVAREHALREWPLTVRESRARSWPAHLREASLFLGPDLESSLVRVINHVKLGWQPGRPLQAKAYLRIQHRWQPATGPLGRGPQRLLAQERPPRYPPRKGEGVR